MTLLFSKSWEAPCDDTSLQTGAFGRISRRHVIQSSLPFLPSSPLLLVTLLQHPVKTQTCQGSSGLRALALTVPSQGLPSFPNGKFLHLFKHISLMRPETQYFKTTLHPTLLYPVLLIALILPSLHFFHLMTYYTLCVCVCVCSVAQLCLTLCDSMNQSRHRTQVSCIAGEFFTIWATREAQTLYSLHIISVVYMSPSNKL